MKKNLEFEDEFLTEEMIKTFYPDPGKVVKTSVLNTKCIKIQTKKKQHFGLKTMYSING